MKKCFSFFTSKKPFPPKPRGRGTFSRPRENHRRIFHATCASNRMGNIYTLCMYVEDEDEIISYVVLWGFAKFVYLSTTYAPKNPGVRREKIIAVHSLTTLACKDVWYRWEQHPTTRRRRQSRSKFVVCRTTDTSSPGVANADDFSTEANHWIFARFKVTLSADLLLFLRLALVALGDKFIFLSRYQPNRNCVLQKIVSCPRPCVTTLPSFVVKFFQIYLTVP